MNTSRRITITNSIVCLVLGCSFTGCAATANIMTSVANCFEFRQDLKHELREDRQDLREELARVRQEERLRMQEAMLAEERAQLAQLKQCLPVSAPFTETTIALPLQQQYVFMKPEVDVQEMEELIKLEKDGLEERMARWREDMKAWNERKAIHDRNEALRITEYKNNPRAPFTQPRTCGCQQALTTGKCCCPAEYQGRCGCEQALKCGRCCCTHCQEQEKTCEYAPLKSQPFTEPPPEMPRANILASELPLKMRMQVRHDIGDANVREVRTGRAPLEEGPPRAPFKGPCDPGSCPSNIPCTQPTATAPVYHPHLPKPVVSEDPTSEAETARRLPPPPNTPPVPPPDARVLPKPPLDSRISASLGAYYPVSHPDTFAPHFAPIR